MAATRKGSDGKKGEVGPTPTLVGVLDENRRHILLFLGFMDRSVSRRTCKALLEAANDLPQPEGLSIYVDRDLNYRHGTSCDESTVSIGILTGVESLPKLSALKPTRLRVWLGLLTRRVPLNLLEALADEVADSVKELSVDLTGPEEGQTFSDYTLALQDALFPFTPNVTGLSFESKVPLSVSLSLAMTFSRLQYFYLFQQHDNESVESNIDEAFLQLQVLRHLPESAAFPFDAENASAFIRGVTKIPQLIKVTTSIKKYQSRGDELGMMLQRLPNLRLLSEIGNPEPQLWQALHNVGGHKGLQTLKLLYSTASEEDLRSMTTAVVHDFPALETLHLTFAGLPKDVEEKLLEILSALSCDASLKTLTLVFSWRYSFGRIHLPQDFHSTLQLELQGIEVEVVLQG